ncbi:hypothetical protein D3C86_1677410 [compost metagenome]
MDIHLALHLPVGMVEVRAQGRWQHAVEQRFVRLLAHVQALPAAVAIGTLVDHALAAHGLVVDLQADFGG